MLANAAMFRKKGLALEVAARAEKIYSLIKNNSNLCGACEGALIEAGVDLEEAFASDRVEPKAPPKKKAAITSDSLLPRSTTSMGGYHQEVFTYLLVNLGEAVVTSHALNALRPSAKKQIAKSSLEQLLEYATEIGPHTWVGTGGPLKSAGHMATVARELNKLHGHRLRSLRLPPDWEVDGVYQITQSGPNVLIEHKWLQNRKSRVLPATQRALVHKLECLKIECNWSSRNAVLVEEGGSLSYPLRSLFGSDFGDDPFEAVQDIIMGLPEVSATTVPMITAAPDMGAKQSEVKIPFSIQQYGRAEMLDQQSRKRPCRGASFSSVDSQSSKKHRKDALSPPSDVQSQRADAACGHDEGQEFQPTDLKSSFEAVATSSTLMSAQQQQSVMMSEFALV